MSELTDSQIDAIKTDVDPWLEAIEVDSDYFKIKRHIVDLQSRLAAAEAARDNLLAEAEKLRDDLLMRADVGSDGTKVVAAGFSRWLKFNEAIDKARGAGDE